MKLKRLELLGFKSFANNTQITFNEGITGIVGPNGSGKSNIGDAVRWVLGEQSAKLLRGTKMEDIIFNGTERKKALPYCEVSLVFDNSDSALNTNFSEVLVTRRIYRSGDTGYFLNKKACRLKDILDLFRDTGIGKEGYSIIGQGRIDEILSQKGEERRRVFEEAAGIVTFRVRKEGAESNLQKTEEQIVRINDILDEIFIRIGPLKEQAEIAKEYLSLAERLKALDIDIFAYRYSKINEKIEVLKQQLQKNQAIFDENKSNQNELSKHRSNIEAEIQESDLLISDKRQVLSKKIEELYNINNSVENIKTNISNSSSKIQELKEQLSDSIDNTNKISDLLNSSSILIKEKELDLNIANKNVEDEKLLLAKLINSADETEALLNIEKNNLIDATNKKSDFLANEARQKEMLSQMQKRQIELENSLSSLNVERDKIEKRLDALLEEGREIKNLISSEKAEIVRLEKSENEANKKLSDDNYKLNSAKNDLIIKQNKYNLANELSNSYEGYYLSVKKSLEYFKNDKDVHGVVAKLIKVPQELENAIEMILGGTLQHIVTNDEETAKKIISYLKTNKLGRATFLPVSAIKSKSLSEKEKDSIKGVDGVIGIASDIISYKPIYKSIIESLLGRTLITENIDIAIKIGRNTGNSFNIVTKGGEVIRAGGSITGGTAKNETVSILKREREIENLETEIDNLSKYIDSLSSGIQKDIKKYESLTMLISELNSKIRDDEILLIRNQERIQSCKIDNNNCLNNIESINSARLQLDDSINELLSDFEKYKGVEKSSEFNFDEMEKNIHSHQEELFLLRSKIEDKRKDIENLQFRANELFNEHRELIINLKNTKNSEEQLDKQILYINEQIEKNDAEIVCFNEDLSKKQHESSNLIREKQHLESELKEFELKHKELYQKLKNVQNDIESLYNQSSVISNEIHKNELNLSKSEDELSSRINYLWNSYEMTANEALEKCTDLNVEISKSEKEANEIKHAIKAMGNVNVSAIDEYAETKERYDNLTIQQSDLTKARIDLLELISKLQNQMSTQFIEEFNKLNDYFKETFNRLFGGGYAELSLDDASKPLECGINITAQPPGKKLQLLSLLSGGERALTAIAILFAMLKLKPTPFCILDEIEAALDEANIGYFANYLEEYKKTTQFVVVTHRKGTMEHCDSLYGIAMQEKGVSSMVSVNLENYS